MTAPGIDRLVLTCEHGGNRVPPRYADLFRGAGAQLASHRGWDPGALGLARRAARRLRAPLHHAEVTRLLVELNRSEGHPALFSEFVRDLPAAERERILARWWRPYRSAVGKAIAREIGHGRVVLHVSFHSFTPVWRGRRRATDVGLLLDPARSRERVLGERWQALLRELLPGLAVHRNRPYRGWTDGLTTTLRGRFPAARYLGIELEVNQRFFTRDGRPRPGAGERVARAIMSSLARVNPGGLAR